MENNKTYQDLENKIRALEEKDIEQQKLIKTLTEKQNLQETILSKSLVGYYITSNGKFYAMNPVAVSYTGYKANELIGKESDYLIHPDDKDEVAKNAHAMIKGKRTSPYEFRIITKQGHIRWIMEAVTPIMLQGKRAILGNAMDITQRKLDEQKLTENENLYRTIFESTGAITAIIEDDKMLSLINSEFEKVTGHRREEWEGKKKWTDLASIDEIPRMSEYHRLRRIDPGLAPSKYEYNLVDSRGRIRRVLTTVNVIPGTRKHVSSSIDITEMKANEIELVNKNKALDDLNATLRVLLKQREEDRKEFETKLLSNIKELVLPCIEKIRQGSIESKDLAYVDLLESNLKNILAPFSHILLAKYMSLSSKEIEVANFIKEGKNSKDIAQLLNISSSCVDIHRYHIRKKLGLNKKRANLKSYLSNTF